MLRIEVGRASPFVPTSRVQGLPAAPSICHLGFGCCRVGCGAGERPAAGERWELNNGFDWEWRSAHDERSLR